MHGVEELGLLKMDFLGLRNLDVITDTRRAHHAHPRRRPRHRQRRRSTTQPTYELLQRGDSIGVFQLEGGADARADALARARPASRTSPPSSRCTGPGPMAANMHNDYADRKNGRKPIAYLHPDAEEVLGDTYGLMIYQESVMRVAQKFAGYSLAEADNLRKACGKKIRELIAKEREKFVDGLRGHRLRRASSARSCSTSSSRSPTTPSTRATPTATGSSPTRPPTSRRTTRSSTSPRCSRASRPTSTRRRSTSPSAGTMGIAVLVPDVNRSAVRLHRRCVDADGDGARRSIPFGLSAVRNVGEGLVALIVAEREANGPFADFYDFCDRVDLAGAQQADDRVADQGRRRSTPSATPARACSPCSSRSSTRTVARRRERGHGQS